MSDNPLPEIPSVTASDRAWRRFWRQMAVAFKALRRQPGAESMAAHQIGSHWMLTGGTPEQQDAFRRTAAHAGRAKARFDSRL